MEVFEILKTLREKNNLTQEEMAKRINITRQAIGKFQDSCRIKLCRFFLGFSTSNSEILY